MESERADSRTNSATGAETVKTTSTEGRGATATVTVTVTGVGVGVAKGMGMVALYEAGRAAATLGSLALPLPLWRRILKGAATMKAMPTARP